MTSALQDAQLRRANEVLRKVQFGPNLQALEPEIHWQKAFLPLGQVFAGALRVTLSVRVPNVETGQPSPIIVNMEIGLPEFDFPDAVHRMLFRGFKQLVIHEIEEGFWVDGKPVINPHPEFHRP